MERVYDETEDNNLKPTAACYHGVITGITLCKDLFQKCCREGQLTNTSLCIDGKITVLDYIVITFDAKNELATLDLLMKRREKYS